MESNVWLIASIWMGLALLASIVSIKLGVSVALVEILVGVCAGNLFGIHSSPWIDFLARFGSGLLTFLVTALIGSAVVPTVIAQKKFLPDTRIIDRTEEDIEAFPSQ